jgi:hypothetical protein
MMGRAKNVEPKIRTAEEPTSGERRARTKGRKAQGRKRRKRRGKEEEKREGKKREGGNGEGNGSTWIGKISISKYSDIKRGIYGESLGVRYRRTVCLHVEDIFTHSHQSLGSNWIIK